MAPLPATTLWVHMLPHFHFQVEVQQDDAGMMFAWFEAKVVGHALGKKGQPDRLEVEYVEFLDEKDETLPLKMVHSGYRAPT